MNVSKRKHEPSEIIFWSIALPGFGQLLNRKYAKGFLLITLEVLINVKGNINLIIMYSFLGEMEGAIQHGNFLWVMFYPCVYLFAIWDAFRDSLEQIKPYSYLPFVFSAYFGTIGVIYSVRLDWIGPVFLPILSMILGLLIGGIIMKILRRIQKQSKTPDEKQRSSQKSNYT